MKAPDFPDSPAASPSSAAADNINKDAAIHSIDTLLEKLREKEARIAAELVAEKEALLAQKEALLAIAQTDERLSQALTSVPVTEAGPEGEGGDAEVPTHGLESELTSYSEYLKAQRKSNARWHNSVLSSSIASTVRGAEEMQVIRNFCRRKGGEWSFAMSQLLGGDENETDEHQDQGHGSKTPWYLPPIQRQRWGEDQDLPHIDWGDLFFDLFYVGAAFNL
jgi:hypothetical protein